jgi:orotate phosphoribosyltransferase
VNDQTRVATPFDAIRDGADALVVGRPIHAAADPAAAARELVQEIARGLEARRGAAVGGPSETDVLSTRLLRMLRDSGAFLEGHFILTSGLHSDRYVQCAQLLQHPHWARRAGMWLAERLRPYDPEVVLSPALGGVVIGQEVAAALGVRSLFAERDATGALQMRRGFSLRPGERVAIVDDVCTRGGSIAECARVVQEQGGTSVVTGAIIDRSGGTRSFSLPFEALLTVQAKALRPEECPACAAGSAAVKPGSRRS